MSATKNKSDDENKAVSGTFQCYDFLSDDTHCYHGGELRDQSPQPLNLTPNS